MESPEENNTMRARITLPVTGESCVCLRRSPGLAHSSRPNMAAAITELDHPKPQPPHANLWSQTEKEVEMQL